MEFMYCIPNLEVFIDKTIKKCLLEYDLDANDTEAVLDDMEKAWPKSPLRQEDAHDLKDCNDNSEKIKNGRISGHQGDDKMHLNASILDDLKSNNHVLPNEATSADARDLVESELEKKEEGVDAVAYVKKELDHVISEGYRSESSSPDVGDGRLQALKHPKLKTMLQQRYFEGQEKATSDLDQSVTKSEDKLEFNWATSKLMSSNLDLLASAANIHTQSVKASEEACKRQELKRIHEESGKHNEINIAGQVYNVNGLKTSRPELNQRMSPSTSHAAPTTRSPETQGPLNREKTPLLFQHSLNGHTLLVPQAREMSSGEVARQTLVIGRSSEARDVNTAGTASSAHFSKAVPNPCYQPQTHNRQDRSCINSESFLEPYHYHGSRIANIIAEELLREDDCVLELQTRETQSSLNKVQQAYEVAPSSMRLRSFSSPGPYKKIISTEPVNFNFQISSAHTHTDMHSKVTTSSASNAAVSTHTKQLSQLLPAHLVRTNTHPGTTILVSHLNNRFPTGRPNRSPSSNNITEDEQPEDLSTKPKVTTAESYRNGHYKSVANCLTPVTENGTIVHFPLRSSPSSAFEPARPIPSPVLHNSHAPCNRTDPGYDTKVNTCPPIKNRVTKDQVEGSQTMVNESCLLAMNRSPQTGNNGYQVGEPVSTKRRRLK